MDKAPFSIQKNRCIKPQAPSNMLFMIGAIEQQKTAQEMIEKNDHIKEDGVVR